MRCIACYVMRLHAAVSSGDFHFKQELDALEPPPTEQELALAEIEREARRAEKEAKQAEIRVRSQERKRAKRAAHLMEKFGVTLEWLEAHPAKVLPAFKCHRYQAAARGIAFDMTLTEWAGIWMDSGKWDERGPGRGYVMSRIGDVGPYAVGNVAIKTGVDNVLEGFAVRREAAQALIELTETA